MLTPVRVKFCVHVWYAHVSPVYITVSHEYISVTTTMPLMLASCLNGLGAHALGPAVSSGDEAIVGHLVNVMYLMDDVS